MSRLIDADKLAERIRDWGKSFYDFNVELALGCLMDEPTIDLWHYPSKGEYPPSGEEVLCLLWGTTPDVGCWNEKDKLWHFDEFEEEDVDCWQYIIPPKEEATKQCTNCGHYKNNVCERTKTHPNKPKEWTCLDWKEEE